MDVWEVCVWGWGGGGGEGGGKEKTLKNYKTFFQGGKIFRSVIKYFLFPPVCVGFR